MYFNFKPKQINLQIVQGASYYKRWCLRRNGAAFPFYDTDGNLLWTASFTIRKPGVNTVVLELTTEAGVTIDKDETETYYGIQIEPEVTATFTNSKYSYVMKFERIADGFIFRLHEGYITVLPEVF